MDPDFDDEAEARDGDHDPLADYFPHAKRYSSPDDLAELKKGTRGGSLIRIPPFTEEDLDLQVVPKDRLYAYSALSEDSTLLTSLATLPLGALLGVLTNVATSGSRVTPATIAYLGVLLMWTLVLAGLAVRKRRQVEDARRILTKSAEDKPSTRPEGGIAPDGR